jgi:hypothetical protein
MISMLRRKTMLTDGRRADVWRARRHELKALRFVVLGLVLLFGFTAVFSSAFHNPQPHQLPVAVVGPPSTLAAARGALDPQRFYAVPYASEAAARAALEREEVHGALVGGRVLIASASGFVAAQTAGQALTQVAARMGSAATLEDVEPLPPHDSRGLSSFVTVTSTMIASIVVAVLLTLLGGAHALRTRLLALVLVAGLGGIAVATSVDITVGALTGDFGGIAGVISLLVLAVGLTVHGLGRLIGHAGAGLAAMAFIVIGVTSSGGGVGHQFQPGFFRAVSQVFPNGAAITALRNEVYLAGAHTVGALLVLCAWAAGGAVALLVGHHRGPLFAT